MAMLVWAAVLLTYGVSAGNAMDTAGAVAGAVAGTSTYPLDMAPNSVDDMYSNCNDKMNAKLPGYLQNERNKDMKFNEVWEAMEKHYNEKIKKLKPFLGKEWIIALYIYTSGPGNYYLDFNAAVRDQGPEYKTSFGLHALHFLLTDAIQALRRERGEDECIKGYRRTGSYFDHKPNTLVRFGSFTSSSKGLYSKKVEIFGDKTCFKIKTCMGADVSLYSKFENEGEVLIPPYEVFKVVRVKKRSQQPDLPCEVEYKLESTGTPVSNLDCALFK